MVAKKKPTRKMMMEPKETAKMKRAEKGMPEMKSEKAEKKKKGIKTSGTYKGKSNKLGYGGRAQQLKDKGVPGGVIGNLARKAQAAPGQKNYHGKRKAKK